MSNQFSRDDLKEIVIKYGDFLFRTCFIMVNNKYDAEDIVQETLIKYYLENRIFNDEDHKKAWLLRVSQNMCKDLLRYKNRHNHVTYDEVSESLVSHDEYKYETIEDYLKIANLDYKYKSVIVLFYMEGYSIDEISRILDISQSAVKMRLKRGKEKLKDALSEFLNKEVL